MSKYCVQTIKTVLELQHSNNSKAKDDTIPDNSYFEDKFVLMIEKRLSKNISFEEIKEYLIKCYKCIQQTQTEILTLNDIRIPYIYLIYKCLEFCQLETLLHEKYKDITKQSLLNCFDIHNEYSELLLKSYDITWKKICQYHQWKFSSS